MEAEYMSSSGAARQVIWLQQLLLDLGLSQVNEPTRVYNDNTASLSLSKNPINHDWAKHIDIIYLSRLSDPLRPGMPDHTTTGEEYRLVDDG